MNNDYLRHGKEYPATVQAMVVWLSKRRGSASRAKLDVATDGVTSFAQIDNIVCRHCQDTGHFNWDCPKASASQRDKYRELSQKRDHYRQDKSSDDSSVGSNGSGSSAGSHASSSSNRSASGGNVRSKGRRPGTPRRTSRRGVFEMSNFAFGVEGKGKAFS